MFSRIILSLSVGLILVSPVFAVPAKLDCDSNSVTSSAAATSACDANESTIAKTRQRLTKLWEHTFVLSENMQFVTQTMLRKSGPSGRGKIQQAISQGPLAVWTIADRNDPGYPKELVLSVSDSTL